MTMKKADKEWIKNQLLSYLEDNNMTIGVPSSSFRHRVGIIQKKSEFKQHWNDCIDEYITTKYHLKSNYNETEEFYKFLFNKRDENYDAVLSFFKEQSPANKTKEQKDGQIVVEDSSNEHYEYQKLILEIIEEDENVTFDYIGNLKFMLSEKSLIFAKIKNYFSKNKVESLLEMYLNSNYIKNVEFEREIFNLLEETNLFDKYKMFLPNLKEGKELFDLSSFNGKESTVFQISFDKDSLLKQLTLDKSLTAIFYNLNNLNTLQLIKELNIEDVSFLTNKENTVKKVFFTGDNLNILKIKIAISEFVKIALQGDKDEDLNKIVNLKSDFQNDNESFMKEINETSFKLFNERVNKIYLKENLEKSLTKENLIKIKSNKI